MTLNSKELEETINEVKEFMKNKDMKDLKKKNNEDFIKKMKEQFPDFSENYPGIFDKILDNSIDDPQFIKMLGFLKQMEGGNMSEHDASVEVGKILVDKYVKPVLPSKD